MSKILTYIIILLFLATGITFFYNSQRIRFENINEIPSAYLDALDTPLDYGRYLKKVLGGIRHSTDKIDLFYRSDIEKAYQKALAPHVAAQMSNQKKYDLNGDGKYDLQEMNEGTLNFLAEQGREVDPSVLSKNAFRRKLDEFDLNSDGYVDTEEMKILPEDKARMPKIRAKRSFNSYFEADFNGDDVLEVDEIEKMAYAVFRYFDSNKDMTVSREEFAND